jgi:hypothetical protein
MSRELNFFVGFALKPAVLVLSLLALRLIGRRAAGKGRTLLTFSLVTFMAGELFCAADVYVLRRMTLLDESGHDILMAVAFGLFALGIYEHARAASPCWNVRCDKNKTCRLPAAECALSSSYGPFVAWLIAGAAVTAVIPFLARPGVLRVLLPAGIGKRPFGAYLYDRTPEISFLQQKILPLLAGVALGLAAVSYVRKKKITRAGAWLASMGAGALSFVFYRLIVVHFFHPDAVLTDFVEELLEALFLVLLLAGFRRPGTARE